MYVELDVGQLIKDPFFTLFESVGALEVNFYNKRLVVNYHLTLVDHGRENG